MVSVVGRPDLSGPAAAAGAAEVLFMLAGSAAPLSAVAVGPLRVPRPLPRLTRCPLQMPHLLFM